MKIRGLFRKNNPILFFSVRIADVLGIVIAGYLAYLVKFDQAHPIEQLSLAIAITTGATLALLVLPRFGSYRGWRGNNVFFDFHRLIAGWIMTVLLCIAIAFVTKTSTLLSREWVILWMLISPAVMALMRAILNFLLANVQERGWTQVQVLIVGGGELGRGIARRLMAASWTGYGVAGFFDDDPALHGRDIDGIPVYGGYTDVAAYIADRPHVQIDEVWLAMPFEQSDQIRKVIHSLYHTPVTIRYVPDIFEFRLINHDVSQVGGIPVIDLNVTPIVGFNRVIKAIEDRVLTGLILILISPVMAALAIGVKLSSPGPVFYRQERVSWAGKPFHMLKFRSMPIDVEEESGPVWAKQNEQRATPFGAFLRRTSLDELPQFINVLKGDMSIVGPRPERPMFVDRFKGEIPDYMQKHLVKGGITGWAQINGWRGDTDLAKRIEYDLFYIENWSLSLDLKIIFLTIFKVFRDRNAY